MRSFSVVVRPDASALLVGGHSEGRRGGDRATARDLRERPLIPASALRGALRIELERLLRAIAPENAACSANLPARDGGAEPCRCSVCRLFGSEGSTTGTLRLDDAVLAPDVVAAEEEELRPGVGVGRRSRTVVAKHLTFVETSGILNADGGSVAFRAPAKLVPRGQQDDAAAMAEDWRNLAAACAALNGLGGGKARGLGWVQCSLDPPALPAPDVPTNGDEAAMSRPVLPRGVTSARVRFEGLAPLHLGDGRPIAFFQRSLRHAPGSTVRGALAFAVLEHGLAQADDPGFTALFGPGSQVSFGSARTVDDVPSTTRRKCRSRGHVFDDLVGELVRRRVAAEGLALAFSGHACVHEGCDATKLVAEPRRRGAPEPVVRVRTRTAVNRLTGTSMDRKLYSIEAIEPPVVLEAELRDLPREAVSLLESLSGREVWLGAKRSRGMGRCRFAFAPQEEEPVAAARGRIEALHAALGEAWSAIGRAVGERLQRPFVPAGRVPLAIVLREPWMPRTAAPDFTPGPLAGRSPALIDAFLETSEVGRFGANEALWYGAPEHVRRGETPPVRAAVAGSVYVYSVEHDELEARLEQWVQRGRAGGGPHREIGWGRFAIRGPNEDF